MARRSARRVRWRRPPQPQGTGLPGDRRWLAPLLLAVAGVACYAGSFDAPFLFDDSYAIVENRHIRQIFPLSQSLRSPPQSPTSGRPLVSLSLAVNYAFGGLNTWGYHAFNTAVHILAAIVLWGVANRTLRTTTWGKRRTDGGAGAALAIALVWLVHPLQSEAVVYVIQRTELMMGLLLLATLYASIRAWDDAGATAWTTVAVVCCALGMLCKEVMAAAPLIVVAHDMAFGPLPVREMFRRRARLYAGLAATWMILAVVIAGGPRSESVGFHHGMSATQYFKVQAWAIPRYLLLSFWPAMLCFDYGDWQSWQDLRWVDVAPGLGMLAAIVGLTLWGWRKLRWVGFLGTWFFVILAPSSSIVPIVSEVAAERRMYLPLVAVVAAVVIAVCTATDALTGLLNRFGREVPTGRLGALLLTAATITLGSLTVARTSVYRSPEAIWRDVVAKLPRNARSYNNLAQVLFARAVQDPERVDRTLLDEAVALLEEAVRLAPRYADAFYNLGNIRQRQGDTSAAVKLLNTALSINPTHGKSLNTLGVILLEEGQIEEGIARLNESLRSQPDNTDALYNLAAVQARHGDPAAAVAAYRRLLALSPQDIEAHRDLGLLLSDLGRLQEAEPHLALVVQANPSDQEARNRLARVRQQPWP